MTDDEKRISMIQGGLDRLLSSDEFWDQVAEHQFYTNLKKKELVESAGAFSGIFIAMRLYPDVPEPDIYFYSSENSGGALSGIPRLVWTARYGESDPWFACAIKHWKINNFCRSAQHLFKELLEKGLDRYDGGSDVGINDRGEELIEEIDFRFQEFVQQGEWIDEDVSIFDCYDYWTDERISSVISSDMSEEQACAAIFEANESVQNRDFRIIGDPTIPLLDYLDRNGDGK